MATPLGFWKARRADVVAEETKAEDSGFWREADGTHKGLGWGKWCSRGRGMWVGQAKGRLAWRWSEGDGYVDVQKHAGMQ